jgi:kumamolisin
MSGNAVSSSSRVRSTWRALTLALALVTALCLLAQGARAAVLAGAARVGPAPSSERLTLVLPLAAREAALARWATEVTTIGSPEYAEYESIARLASRFGASPRTRARVTAFLQRSGATHVRIDATGLFADATLQAGAAERLFGTSLSRFRTAHNARFTAPDSAIRIPTALRGLVTGVVGLNTRPIVTAPPVRHLTTHGAHVAQASSAPSGYVCASTATPSGTPCAGQPTGCTGALATGGFTPNEYLTAYGYTALPAGTQGQGERVAVIEIDGFKQSDIQTFASCFGLGLPPIDTFLPEGVHKPLPPGAETTLDLEVLDSVAPDLKSIDVYESQADAADTLSALTAPLQNPGYKPEVISASLGQCEPFVVQDVGQSGIKATEGALEEAAASGISFLAASGDDGAEDCTNNGTPLNGLAVNYPASSWWATGVGGTNFVLSAQNTITSQVVWNDTTVVPGAAGGGGLSALFARPSWQQAVVTGKARSVPDVAMLADIAPGYAIFCTAPGDCLNSQETNPWQTVGGTSAGTPLLAGGFALVDQLLLARKLQALGLANPLLYNIGSNATLAPQVFSDVTEGSNDVGPFVSGIGTPLGCCTAAVGYDDASGWGSVNLAAFATQALATQPAVVDITMTLPGGQRPVHSKHIVTSVSCSGACLIGSVADVRIAHHRSFTAYSALHQLNATGSLKVKIVFTKPEIHELKTAVKHHNRIVATVLSAIVDAAGNIERTSATVKLKIKH